MFAVYAYANCSTCRKALRWLEVHSIPHRVVAIRESPPSIEELEFALTAAGGELRRLFNTSGADYRAMNLKETLPTLSTAEALRLLSTHGNLVKRPFFIGNGIALSGFDEARWTAALASH